MTLNKGPGAKHERRIFLFDVDGVIVNPIAYRMGITETLLSLCGQIGLQDIRSILPQESEISAMEAQGVHDVWDMTNIIFCEILTQIALSSNEQDASVLRAELDGSGTEKAPAKSSSNFNSNTSQLLGLMRQLTPSVVRPNYSQLANSLASTMDRNHPPDIAMDMFSQKLKGSAHEDVWIKLMERFLIGTRSAYSSYGTRLFQNIILGAADFERTYELPSDCAGEGLLRTEDITLINSDTVKQLIQMSKQTGNKVGVYTARPSLPPKQANSSAVGYSPEAEIALGNAGMSTLPLIGMGMMEWLGKQHQQRTEDLTKPNSTQALAALINTITGGDDVLALNEAYAIDKQGKKPAETSLSAIHSQRTVIYVFEDTISGIIPLQKSVQMLNTEGFDIQLEALGIATDARKRESLEKHCRQVFANVNEAFGSIQ